MTDLEAVDLTSIMSALTDIGPQLHRGSPAYALLERVAYDAVRCSGFAEGGSDHLGDIGQIILPYRRMGSITTLDLFGLDELILFSLYLSHQDQYRRVADLGANVGLHSIIMSKLGWDVYAFEADPGTFDVLSHNLSLNSVTSVDARNLAVSDADGEAEFVRVLGNLTGSHLSGDKENPYGQLERFTVGTAHIASIMAAVDFIKMDVEGSEARIIEATVAGDWTSTDMVLEIGTRTNAARIFKHLTSLGVGMFSQKRSWARVDSLTDLPHHHTQGLVFCSASSNAPWGGSRVR